MADEEYVRSVWGWVQVRLAEPFEGIAQGKWTLRLPLLPFSQVGFDTEAEAWSAAAKFTRECEEQVRQLRKEMHYIECQLMPPPKTLIRESVEEGWPESMVLDYVCEVCAYSRILARLKAELSRLTTGMKSQTGGSE